MKGLRELRGPSRLTLASTALLVLVGIVALVGLFWLLFNVVRPAPPSTVTMVTGAPGGAYALFAERYRSALAREGIELVLRPSSGSIENLRLLKTDPEVSLGFVQSGITWQPDTDDLVQLGSLYLEPVWIFHRLDHPLAHLRQLEERRIAVGAEGSGTQLVALQMLGLAGIAPGDSMLAPLDATEAARALQAGDVDAAFIIAGIDAPSVRKLLNDDRISLAALEHAPAYQRRMPQLAKAGLPAGTLDLAELQPPEDIDLLGATATLVARSDLHPAIVSLMLLTARDIHSRAGLLQEQDEYPALLHHELPRSAVAERFYESGPPFLQRYLPFWLAVLADRLLVALLPLIALLIPLLRIAPALYAWRMRSRIYSWYGELKFLEERIEQQPDRASLEDCLQQLDRIEHRANHRRIPLSYNSELYTLREHIQLVRRRLREVGDAAESHSTDDTPREATAG